MGDRGHLAVLFLCHRWLVSLSWLYSRRRPDCQQDLHDQGGGRKHSVAPLSGSITSQNSLLFQIRGNAGTLDSIVTSLPQIPGCPSSSMNHSLIQQRRNQDDRIG